MTVTTRYTTWLKIAIEYPKKNQVTGRIQQQRLSWSCSRVNKDRQLCCLRTAKMQDKLPPETCSATFCTCISGSAAKEKKKRKKRFDVLDKIKCLD